MTEPKKLSGINIIFILFIASSVIVAGFTGRMEEITNASFESAKGAVTLAIGLIGIMALWLGLMRVLEAGGLLRSLARGLKPVMTRLFPDVPTEHPAMSAMILNISANMLGLGNAATPFGIKAMIELNRLNPLKGTASHAMCLFLVINTSSVALLPLGVIGVRAAAGSTDPAAIFFPTLLATLTSTIIGITAVFLFRSFSKDIQPEEMTTSEREDTTRSEETSSPDEIESYEHLQGSSSSWQKAATLLGLGLFGSAFLFRLFTASTPLEFLANELATYWLMPALMFFIIAFGLYRGVHVYEAVTEGAKQGFDVAVRIIPYLVAILVAIAMFRASGAMDYCARLVTPLTSLIAMPADVLPMALVRPLSGSGAFGIMSAIIEQAPNSYSAFVASTMMGSTETTFYVLAVYFGAVRISRVRYALPAALLADAAGIVAACLLAQQFWG